MDDVISRRTILTAGISFGSLALVPKLARAQATDKPPKLPEDLVHDFVVAAHVDLEKTQKLLEEHPRLLNATWDWSNGDFEMAIGGAGHMGRRDIAQYLISKGGRYDLFVAAMMDEVEIVKPILTAHPDLLHSKGPHGIPLKVHAEHGKAERVLEFLKSIPD